MQNWLTENIPKRTPTPKNNWSITSNYAVRLTICPVIDCQPVEGAQLPPEWGQVNPKKKKKKGRHVSSCSWLKVLLLQLQVCEYTQAITPSLPTGKTWLSKHKASCSMNDPKWWFPARELPELMSHCRPHHNGSMQLPRPSMCGCVFWTRETICHFALKKSETSIIQVIF